jgi:UDP-2,4-diacetamido-2,4,6-trideoxy-beta-L-altropyranose hydrolase
MSRNILFRADSSSAIGTGHVMRDLVLAEQFKDANIIFATQNLEGNINHKIEEKNYRIEILNSNDINEIITLIHQYSIDTIVIDNYEIDYNYEKELKERTSVTIFVLDDTYERHFCDILLNHNIGAGEAKYKGLVPEDCSLRCGIKYTLLREEFIKEKQTSKKLIFNNSIKNIFIAMGGADHSNINVSILKVLESFSNFHAHVVTTTANPNLDELKTYTQGKQNITLHINTDQIASLMNKSNFAIVTPSVTLNEIFYMEVPFIAIKTADNQKEMYCYLVKNNYFALENFNPIELKNTLKKLIDLNEITLINFINLSLVEKKMVLEWRNNINIRKWMLTKDLITLDGHLTYIESLAQKKDRLYFLVKKGNQPIGVIDFTDINQKNKTTKFGIYANPTLKQVGNLLMDSTIHYAFNILKSDTLIAKVFENNIRAITLYKKFNFKKIVYKNTDNEHLIHMELKR